MNKIIAYTDGSCNNRLPMKERDAGWAVVFIDEDEKLIGEECGSEGQSSSGRAELLAVFHAIERLNSQYSSFKNKIIRSDSAYIIKTFQEKWYERWQLLGFIGVKNEKLWRKILSIYKGDIVFEHVKGHSGNVFNEYADKLANYMRNKRKEQC
jgi:ribonuclease HI